MSEQDFSIPHLISWLLMARYVLRIHTSKELKLNFFAMKTAPSKVEALRKLLFGAMRQCKFLMDKQIVTGNLQKYLAIEELTQRFNIIKNESLDTHYLWLVTLRNQVINIMPPAAGRYDSERMKLVQLLNEAENKINTLAKVRVAIG